MLLIYVGDFGGKDCASLGFGFYSEGRAQQLRVGDYHTEHISQRVHLAPCMRYVCHFRVANSPYRVGGGGFAVGIFAMGYFAFQNRARFPTQFSGRCALQNLAQLLVLQLPLPHAEHL